MTSGHSWEEERLRAFQTGLSQWYQASGRDLPWRRTSDPYRIWISEIMLQQTTVAAVIPYFERFMNEFPDIQSLANADEQDVLKLWEGLGYYSRARNIHKAANVIIGQFHGVIPSDPAELEQFPGVGRYTAGAIASFAFDRKAPIVEANTLRLYCRLMGYDGDPRSSAGQKQLWQFAEHVLPDNSPGDFNQAMMELGATICSPAEPDCEECPVCACCRSFHDGTQAEIPKLAKRPKVTPLIEATVAIFRDGKVLLWQNQPGEWWSGLWGFPRFTAPWKSELPDQPGAALPIRVNNRLEKTILQKTGLAVETPSFMKLIRHSVTRYRIALYCFTAEFEAGEVDCNGRPTQWVSPEELSGQPLSMTARKLAEIVATESFNP
ncbi:MAG: A/G-specific adenine glycosylase [Planctomycetaceae bacterium]|nr:A/G-specific adenine glycosylase [Planctomycetaceae bacterium]